ncbi:MAG TPA: response regulator [Cyclobacteriaceae bacterium]|nr:response regulator [Cyclobacteriaceae bacterium]
MVYLVDDDFEDLEIVQHALFEHSYKGPVVTMENGKQLIDSLASGNIDDGPKVIVLDLNMPLLDGFETLSRIRQHPTFGSTPVIILTASSKKNDEVKSYELGCNFFLTKPAKISEYETLTTLIKTFVAATTSHAS